jgi:6-phosphogluconolactonase
MGSCVAYVGSYTNYGKSKGITIFDVNEENGKLQKRGEVEVNNCSYLCVSADKRYLYAVVDEGVASFSIDADGNLQQIGLTSIKGMRGCYISVDSKNRYLFVAGYHDGKVTVLRIRPDGVAGEITDYFFEQSYGSVVEGNFRPHISCVKLTPDEKYLCTVSSGIDQIKVFRVDYVSGGLEFVDIIHCEVDSAPRQLEFSPDGRHMYVMGEKKTYIVVYNYEDNGKRPVFTFKQLVSTIPHKSDEISVACAVKVSADGRYVFATNAGSNTLAVFERHPDDGLLYQRFVLPISGEYPKDVELFPDQRNILCMNNMSGAVTSFRLHYDGDFIVMNDKPYKCDNPNCGVIVQL